MTTTPQSQSVEEIVKKIVPQKWGVDETQPYRRGLRDGWNTARLKILDEIYPTLLSLRREWLEDRVKKMEGMKITSMVGIGLDADEKSYNRALQTLIDADRKELEELTN